MSAKAIREYHGKKIVSDQLPNHNLENRALLISPLNCDFAGLAAAHPWVHETRLVVKPDQLIKRRGKAGLLGLNKTWVECVEWVSARMNKEQQVERVSGVLDHFIVEPFVPHADSDEYYICIQVNDHVSIPFYMYAGFSFCPFTLALDTLVSVRLTTRTPPPPQHCLPKELP